MKAEKTGSLLLLTALVLIAGIRTGSAHRDLAEEGEREELTGCIRLVGSSSMERYVSALAEGFMEKYPDITVTVQYTGSGAGITAVAEGSAQIGISSRYLENEEKAKGVAENLVGLDGIVLCVDAENPVQGLTGQQLADIYTGKIRNWADVGGADLPVVVIGREAGSGTRHAFEELLGVEECCTYANELDSTGAVAARVASTPGAIGYVSLDILNRKDSEIRALSLDGVRPSTENIASGSYRLYRPFIMITKGALSEQDAAVGLWFSYVYGEAGKQAAEMSGVLFRR